MRVYRDPAGELQTAPWGGHDPQLLRLLEKEPHLAQTPVGSYGGAVEKAQAEDRDGTELGTS